MDSGKQALQSSAPAQPAPAVTDTTDHITQEAYTTETSAQTAHGPEPVTEEQVAPAATKPSKGGPINAIRNFFSRLFGSLHRHDDQRKSNNTASSTAPAQTAETTTPITTASVATSNPPILS